MKNLNSPRTVAAVQSQRAVTMMLYPVPLIVFLVAWQLYTISDSQRQFIFSSPEKVYSAFTTLIVSGDLVRHSAVTLMEALTGFVLGTTCGAVIGLSLWYSRLVSTVAKPYITALGSIPIFALAPMIIAWFGIGIVSKIALAFLSTVVVAIVQSYQGAMSAEPRFLRLMQVFGASRLQTFRTVILPSSLIWVVNAMKLNIGLALLGAFIGEFISAEQGLGYMIVRASGLYDMATVIAGVFTLVVLALLLTSVVEQIERRLLPWRSN
ncbi:MAG: ABC transporter permease [Candidatus Obscuribacterales bacterium]|nr:ABC transporter permease [Candidatus Obscuribacterales bacterium]